MFNIKDFPVASSIILAGFLRGGLPKRRAPIGLVYCTYNPWTIWAGFMEICVGGHKKWENYCDHYSFLLVYIGEKRVDLGKAIKTAFRRDDLVPPA